MGGGGKNKDQVHLLASVTVGETDDQGVFLLWPLGGTEDRRRDGGRAGWERRWERRFGEGWERRRERRLGETEDSGPEDRLGGTEHSGRESMNERKTMRETENRECHFCFLRDRDEVGCTERKRE